MLHRMVSLSLDVYDIHYFSGIHIRFGECGTLPVEEILSLYHRNIYSIE